MVHHSTVESNALGKMTAQKSYICCSKNILCSFSRVNQENKTVTDLECGS